MLAKTKILALAAAAALFALPLQLGAVDPQETTAHTDAAADHTHEVVADVEAVATDAEIPLHGEHAVEDAHGGHAADDHGDAHAGGHHATPVPEVIFTIPFGDPDAPAFVLPITNSMVTSWVIALALIITVRLAVGRPKIIPGRGQAIVETLLSGIRELIAPIVGRHMVKHTFPLLVTLFTFILIQNWSGMLPGVGSVYSEHEGVRSYLIRPGNADINMTLALALVHFIAWAYFVLRYAGPRVLLFDIFGNKADPKEVPIYIYVPLFAVFAAVGFIEIISIIFRNISLPFRLFGNVYGGENLLTSMTGLVSWVVPVPFYMLEVLIGFVQALVFTLLVAVYIGLICNHESEEGHH